MNWRHVQHLLLYFITPIILFLNCNIGHACYATQETYSVTPSSRVFFGVHWEPLSEYVPLTLSVIHFFAYFGNSRPVWECHLSLSCLSIKLIVSEQGGTVPPCLWNPDRIDLSRSDHQAEKKPQPAANCLDTSGSVAAPGNSCQMCIWYCSVIVGVWEPLPSSMCFTFCNFLYVLV